MCSRSRLLTQLWWATHLVLPTLQDSFAEKNVTSESTDQRKGEAVQRVSCIFRPSKQSYQTDIFAIFYLDMTWHRSRIAILYDTVCYNVTVTSHLPHYFDYLRISSPGMAARSTFMLLVWFSTWHCQALDNLSGLHGKNGFGHGHMGIRQGI